MTAASELDIQTRETLGTGSSRGLRRDGRIPAVLYGGGEEPVHLSVNGNAFVKALHQKGFMSTIFQIKKEKALVRTVQFHPVTDRPLHIDFFRVKAGSKVNLSVPVTFVNETASPGLKQGGVLNVLVHTLEISADKDCIPENIEVDLTGLEIGQALNLADIVLPSGVAATNPERDSVLANLVPPTVMKESEPTQEVAAEEGEETAPVEDSAASEEDSPSSDAE